MKIYDIKVIAILQGLKQVFKHPMTWIALGIYICLDNREVTCNTGEIPKTFC